MTVLAGCDSGGGPHPFELKERQGYLYKLVWSDSDAPPITIGYSRPTTLRSPDGGAMAFGGEVELKIIDLVHRTTYVPRLGELCSATPILWARQDRLVSKLACGDAHTTTRSELLVLDVKRRRFVGRRQIGLSEYRPTRRGVVLLTGPPLGRRIVPGTAIREERLGAARIVRVRPDGRADEIRLPILAGSRQSRTVNRWPAFVVEPRGRYAYVIGEGDGCARIDLRTLRVELHRLPHAFDAQPDLASPWERHMGTTNPSRDMRREGKWLGDGKIAITGDDTWTANYHDRTAPAGLKILDVQRWTVRTVNRHTFTLRRP